MQWKTDHSENDDFEHQNGLVLLEGKCIKFVVNSIPHKRDDNIEMGHMGIGKQGGWQPTLSFSHHISSQVYGKWDTKLHINSMRLKSQVKYPS